MRIVEPNVEFITEPNPLKRIELCGRVCYKSEARITPDSAKKFVAGIINRGHTSVLEHARIEVPYMTYYRITLEAVKNHINDPYGLVDRTPEYPGNCAVMNARDYIALGGTIDKLEQLHNADDYMTVRFTCDRAIANELVRHRVFSFSQESTRYVNYKDGIEFIHPLPFEWAKDKTDSRNVSWISAMSHIETAYENMIDRGCTPQEARSVLPLSTKTELVMTGTFGQWRDMLKLRLDKAAHPQMRYLMRMMIDHPECPEELKEVAK